MGTSVGVGKGNPPLRAGVICPSRSSTYVIEVHRRAERIRLRPEPGHGGASNNVEW